MIDYLSYDRAAQAVCLHGKEGCSLIPSRSILSWLSQKCMLSGASLQGRKEAYRKLMHARKYIPVLVCLHPPELYLPCGPARDESACWLSFGAICFLERRKTRCVVHFQDGLTLELEGYERLQRAVYNASVFMRLIHSSQSSQ